VRFTFFQISFKISIYDIMFCNVILCNCCLYLTFDKHIVTRIRHRCFWCNSDKEVLWFNEYPQDWHKHWNKMICLKCLKRIRKNKRKKNKMKLLKSNENC